MARKIKKTRLEMIEQHMSPDQLRLMEQIWDNVRWSNYTTYSSTLKTLREIAVRCVKELVTSTTPIEAADACRQAGAAVMWLEEMHRMLTVKR